MLQWKPQGNTRVMGNSWASEETAQFVSFVYLLGIALPIESKNKVY